MSNIEFDTDKKKFKNYLKDVMFLYVRVKTPALKFESKDTYEFVVDCIVDEDTADTFAETFPKSSVKKFKTAIFEEKFGVAPPNPDDKNQFMIKLKADSHYQDGNEVPYEYSTRPKVFLPTEGGVKDVTIDTLVGNGSKGDASFRITSNSFGTFAKLTGIRVDDLVEYEGADGNDSAFGSVVNASEANAKAATTKPAEKAQEEAPQEEQEQSPAELGSDSPF